MKLKLFITLFIFSLLNASIAQNIAITDDNGYTADSSAMLDVKSTSKGLLMPRLTTAQRIAVINPAEGLLVYDTDLKVFYYFDGTTWIDVSSGGQNQAWSIDGSNVHLSDNSNKVGVGTNTPFGKMEVKGDASANINDPIFQVINASGDTVFAVYPEGVRVNVDDNATPKATGSKGGFAVGGFSSAKGTTNEYLRVTPDSVRVYIDPANIPAKSTGSRGGFAVGGFSGAKGLSDSLFLFSDRTGFNVAFLSENQRDSILDPYPSSIIFNTTDSCLQIYLGRWESIWCTTLNCVIPYTLTQPISNTTWLSGSTTLISSIVGTRLNFFWQESWDNGETWITLSDGGIGPNYEGAHNDTLIVTNLLPEHAGYQYRCYVYNNCGNTTTNAAILQLETPVATAVTDLAHTSFTANWNLVSGAQEYFLDVSTQPDFSSFVTGYNNLPVGNVSSYSVTGLDILTDYYYRISVPFGVSHSNTISTKTIVDIGDAYGGGIVFYVDGTNYHGLISATQDIGNYFFGCYGTATGAVAWGVGTGYQNTLDIIANCADTDNAAYMCFDLVLNGYDDWFLPSIDELHEMCLYKDLIGNFQEPIYYNSSTEASSVYQVMHYFYSGGCGAISTTQAKNGTRPTRPIRAF